MQAFSKVTQQEPEHGEAWNNLAALWLQQGGWREALHAAEQGVRLKRDSWQAWDNCATAAVKAGALSTCVRALGQVWSGLLQRCLVWVLGCVLAEAACAELRQADTLHDIEPLLRCVWTTRLRCWSSRTVSTLRQRRRQSCWSAWSRRRRSWRGQVTAPAQQMQQRQQRLVGRKEPQQWTTRRRESSWRLQSSCCTCLLSPTRCRAPASRRQRRRRQRQRQRPQRGAARMSRWWLRQGGCSSLLPTRRLLGRACGACWRAGTGCRGSCSAARRHGSSRCV